MTSVNLPLFQSLRAAAGKMALDELLEKSLPKKSGQEKNRHVAMLTFSHLSLVTFLSIGGMNKSEGLKTVWK